MKFRIAVLTACLAALATPAFSQGTRGIKLGVNMANISIEDEDEGTDSLTGFVGGIYFRAAGNDKVSLQPEILYSMQGAKDSDESDFKLKFNYIQIPVLAHINLGTSPVQPFINVGPSLGIRVKAQAEDGDEEVDLKDDVKMMDLGLVIGAGIQTKRVSVEARYNFGLTNIAESDAPNFGSDLNVKSRVLSIILGVGF